jgi:TPR repeat protein
MRFLPALIFSILSVPLLCVTARGDTPAPLPNPSLADNILSIRLGLMPEAKRFAYVEREYKRAPQDLALKANYAELLIMGKDWGGPKDREAEGVALAREAMKAESTTGYRALGNALIFGRGIKQNFNEALPILQQASREGNTQASVSLGYLLLNEASLGLKVSLSEECFRKVAKRGFPEHLYKLATIYEKNSAGQTISIAKAAALMNEAAQYGSVEAVKQLKQLSKEKDTAPEMRRAYCLTTLWYGSLGSTSLQTAKVVAAAKEMEAVYPNDPEALVALGRAYRNGEHDLRDMKKAFELFTKAIALGSNDARDERASMLAEGLGVKKDTAAALAEWRALELLDHPGALARLGYYSYWGSLQEAGIPKNASVAYAYSVRAADAGNFFGQFNTAQCYASGIGTELNYAMAVAYSQAAAKRGSKQAQKELPKLITAAFD